MACTLDLGVSGHGGVVVVVLSSSGWLDDSSSCIMAAVPRESSGDSSRIAAIKTLVDDLELEICGRMFL
jgi:hypothetical protein